MKAQKKEGRKKRRFLYRNSALVMFRCRKVFSSNSGVFKVF